MLLALGLGLLLGFFGSVPIAGPIAALVASLGLAHRGGSALRIAAGSSIAEAAYAFMAVWGLAAAIGRFPWLLLVSRLAGCAAVAALGVYLVVRERPSAQDEGPERPLERPAEGLRGVLLGFTITIANPTLIVTWTAVVGATQSAGVLRLDTRMALPFAAGVAAGALGWFAVLVAALGRMRSHMSSRAGDRFVRGLGVALILTGIGLALRVLLAPPR
jgi:threonine/homoserine/homoserine lactone efflux protein